MATTAPLWIGGDTTYLNGALDDLSIYNRALSDAEIINLSNNRAGRYEYHHLNALGSNIVLTDDNQNVLVRYEYDVFGAIRSETGTSDNVRKFTAKEWDADARLYYYAARYYDPYIGRFTQRDPVGDGVNWYAYTYNNPLRFIDPDGLRPLNPHEEEIAIGFFGDMIDLENVKIEGPLLEDKAITIYNDIHVDAARLTDDVFIHELVHVWQYQNVRLGILGAGATHLIAWAFGKTDELYDYTIDDLSNPNRKTFSEYSFEEQASIIQDAYRVLHMTDHLGRPLSPKHMKNFIGYTRDQLIAIYEQFLEEFQEWHQRLRESSGSSNRRNNN